MELWLTATKRKTTVDTAVLIEIENLRRESLVGQDPLPGRYRS